MRKKFHLSHLYPARRNRAMRKARRIRAARHKRAPGENDKG